MSSPLEPGGPVPGGPVPDGEPAPRTPRWRLSPRGRALVAGVAVSLALLVPAATVPVPFVAIGPGTTFNTIGSVGGERVISFTGDGVPVAAAATPSGELDMVTIRVVDRLPLVEALGLWLSGRFELAPRTDYYPDGRTKDQVTAANAELFRESQSVAEIQALRHLGYPNVVYVGTIERTSTSWGALSANDQIVAVDGRPVTDYPSLRAVMADTVPGQTVDVTVQRDGTTRTVAVELKANPDVGPQGFLEVGVAERPDAPFAITISLEDIGGPSAGLMFALGIVDLLTEGDLTGGEHIAGTGTIGMDGGVGAIGGVGFKVVAAAAAGADYLLVPAANCDEARAAGVDGITLVRVDDLDGAVDEVRTIAAGGAPTSC